MKGNRWFHYLTFYDPEVLVIALVSAMLGAAFPMRLPTSIAVAVASGFTLFPLGTMFTRSRDIDGVENGLSRRDSYVLSNSIAVIAIAAIVFTLRRLFFA